MWSNACVMETAIRSGARLTFSCKLDNLLVSQIFAVWQAAIGRSMLQSQRAICMNHGNSIAAVNEE